MPHARIICSNCGFTREVPAAALPQKPVNATCPKCKHIFAFDPAAAIRQEPSADNGYPQAPSPPASGRLSLQRGLDARANKLLFVLFLALILVTVGVRLWADGRYRGVPYPNLMAASAAGVAVICGQTVYLYGPDGKLVRSHPFPADIRPTQLFWDKGALCIADMNRKTVLEFGPQANAVRTLTGAGISAQFKVVREPATGRLFVSDGGGHRILVFDDAGKFLRSFGREGSKPGEFRFPNELVFDESGQLLIANTKRPAIEAYTPDGSLVSTLVTPAKGCFRYPTDFVVTPDRLLVLENDNMLENAGVRIYDRKGQKLGELATGQVKLIGDLVADGERLYLSDCEGRQLLAFSLADLSPLGAFSSDLADRCAVWNREAKLFRRLSHGALVALFVFCAPVIFFYLQLKRHEAKEIARVDLGVAAGSATGPAPEQLACATRLTPDRQAVWLSLLFPGLGQLRNGQLQKGLTFIVMAVVVLLLGYVGIKGWFFEGADLSFRDKYSLTVLVVMAPVWYVANIIDAYRSSIRGRKPH